MTQCPPLVTYSRAFQTQVADELTRLPPEAGVTTMLIDYGKLRDACRRSSR